MCLQVGAYCSALVQSPKPKTGSNVPDLIDTQPRQSLRPIPPVPKATVRRRDPRLSSTFGSESRNGPHGLAVPAVPGDPRCQNTLALKGAAEIGPSQWSPGGLLQLWGFCKLTRTWAGHVFALRNVCNDGRWFYSTVEYYNTESTSALCGMTNNCSVAL